MEKILFLWVIDFEGNTPMLYIKDGIDADMLFIVKPVALDM